MKTTFIYSLNDPASGESRYIGMSKTPKTRYNQHIYSSKKPKCHRDSWISSLLGAGLKPVLEVLDKVPKSQWEFWEREYIRVFRAIGFRLTNHTDGGEAGPDITGLKRPEKFCEARRGKNNPSFGKSPSQETRGKISRTKKEMYASGELVALSGPNHPQFGKPQSPEVKAAISKTLKGRIRPVEWCNAIAAGHARRKQGQV